MVVPLSRWDSECYCHLNDSMVGILSMGKSGGFQRLPIGDDAPPNGYCWGTDYHKPRGSWDG
ncbi:MAG: hypothetical protein LBR51_03780, partial [Bacteroidales bacterium]|nr:hypothetical protein [Bacteroidales bacterium]